MSCFQNFAADAAKKKTGFWNRASRGFHELIRITSGPNILSSYFLHWSASRRHARALATGLPRQDHVLITTEQLVRFHKNEFDEMLCRLDSVRYARAFQQSPTVNLNNLKSESSRNQSAWYFKQTNKQTNCMWGPEDTAKVPAEVPEDSRVLRVRRLWSPTSDRLDTWLIPSRTTQSRQCHEATMVWRNLPLYHRF